MSSQSWLTIRKRVLERDGYVCQNCGAFVGSVGSGLPLGNVHHIKLRSDGGSDDLTNLRTLCVGCHAEVHEDDPVPSGLIRTLGITRAYENDEYIDAIKNEGGQADTRTVAERVGCSKDLARIRLNELADESVIVRTEFSHLHVWSIPESEE